MLLLGTWTYRQVMPTVTAKDFHSGFVGVVRRRGMGCQLGCGDALRSTFGDMVLKTSR